LAISRLAEQIHPNTYFCNVKEREAFMSRKKFIESQGATCRNWTWSWSFVNHKAKFVIFGTWNVHKDGNTALILDQDWEYKRGRKQPGYTQAIEHLHLVERESYALKIFEMCYSDELIDANGEGPAKIEAFIPKLETKQLEKKGSKWYAVG
jgi:5-methylcytosine-specific restriction protein A